MPLLALNTSDWNSVTRRASYGESCTVCSPCNTQLRTLAGSEVLAIVTEDTRESAHAEKAMNCDEELNKSKAGPHTPEPCSANGFFSKCQSKQPKGFSCFLLTCLGQPLPLSSPSNRLPHMFLNNQRLQRLILASLRRNFVKQPLHDILRRLVPPPHIRKISLPHRFRDGEPNDGFSTSLHLAYDFVVDGRPFLLVLPLAFSVPIHFHVGVPEPPVAVMVCESSAECAGVAGHWPNRTKICVAHRRSIRTGRHRRYLCSYAA
ncbi:hypothetical protein DL95DRAFT_381554 [Leptodontidium sp. 2 PMI_412]|nr:hypothetical protein DL95DRAFT_381554 [Leptodontidium sp. 2 PMI_412]